MPLLPTFTAFKQWIQVGRKRELDIIPTTTASVSTADQLVISFELQKDMLDDNKELKATVKAALLNYISELKSIPSPTGETVAIPAHLSEVVEPYIGKTTVNVKRQRLSNNVAKLMPTLSY